MILMSNARRVPAMRVSRRAFFVSLATPSFKHAGCRHPLPSRTAGVKRQQQKEIMSTGDLPRGGGAFEREGILDTEHSGRRDHGRLVIEFTYLIAHDEYQYSG